MVVSISAGTRSGAGSSGGAATGGAGSCVLALACAVGDGPGVESDEASSSAVGMMDGVFSKVWIRSLRFLLYSVSSFEITR